MVVNEIRGGNEWVDELIEGNKVTIAFVTWLREVGEELQLRKRQKCLWDDNIPEHEQHARTHARAHNHLLPRPPSLYCEMQSINPTRDQNLPWRERDLESDASLTTRLLITRKGNNLSKRPHSSQSGIQGWFDQIRITHSIGKLDWWEHLTK